jgi:hypothetical protein
MLIELILGDLDGFAEILVGLFRIDDVMAVLGQKARFDGMWRFRQSEGYSNGFRR